MKSSTADCKSGSSARSRGGTKRRRTASASLDEEDRASWSWSPSTFPSCAPAATHTHNGRILFSRILRHQDLGLMVGRGGGRRATEDRRRARGDPSLYVFTGQEQDCSPLSSSTAEGHRYKGQCSTAVESECAIEARLQEGEGERMGFPCDNGAGAADADGEDGNDTSTTSLAAEASSSEPQAQSAAAAAPPSSPQSPLPARRTPAVSPSFPSRRRLALPTAAPSPRVVEKVWGGDCCDAEGEGSRSSDSALAAKMSSGKERSVESC